MNYYIKQLTSRVTISACCLAFMLAAGICHCASPEAPPSLPDAGESMDAPEAALQSSQDELMSRMLTPRAEIRLGPDLADQERLMRRSSNRSLSYTVSALWAGIVEYVFPSHGLFRRGDTLARIYEGDLLSDLERARAQIFAEDAAPLTIAAHAPRTPESDTGARTSTPSPAVDSQPTTDAPPSRAHTVSAAPAAPDSPLEAESNAPPVVVPDFDFEANRIKQEQLKEQAELAATAIPEAIEQCRSALDELNSAREELAQRHRLLEQGVLAERALVPAEERVADAQAAYDRAEAMLVEAQEGYDRIASRITALEDEASAAHEAIKKARDQAARRAEAAARRIEQREAAARETQQPRPTVTLDATGHAGSDAEGASENAPGSTSQQGEIRVYHTPEEMRELAAPRWQEQTADAPGIVSEVIAPEGTTVKSGDALLRVANLQLARVSARVSLPDLQHFTLGRSVTVEFEDYPDTTFGGWVEDVAPIPGTDEADVGLLLVCESGRFTNDPYLALRWMTLEAGIRRDDIGSASLQPRLTTPRSAETEIHLAQMFPTVGPRELYLDRATERRVPMEGHYAGRLRLQSMDRLSQPAVGTEKYAQRLAALSEWRRTYIDGMTTTMLDDGTCISYPGDGDVSHAVRLMLNGDVSHRPNLCAATMREALGWGLGDAHQWATRLPRVGYVPREDGLPRPGDILVWPFTYGPGRSQHIGFAVRQGRKLMLLSNLSGHLGTTEILDGYIAFHRPGDDVTS